MFRPECTSLLQGKDGNWSKIGCTYTWLLVSLQFVHGLSVGVTGNCGMVQLGPVFLISQGSRWSQTQRPCWGIAKQSVHVDVEGFLEWQFSRALGLVHHCGLIPFDGVVILPNMLCYCWLLQHPSLAGIQVLLQSGLKSPLGLTNVGLAAAAGENPVYTPPCTVSPLTRGPSLWKAPSRVNTQIWRSSACHTFCRPA